MWPTALWTSSLLLLLPKWQEWSGQVRLTVHFTNQYLQFASFKVDSGRGLHVLLRPNKLIISLPAVEWVSDPKRVVFFFSLPSPSHKSMAVFVCFNLAGDDSKSLSVCGRAAASGWHHFPSEQRAGPVWTLIHGGLWRGWTCRSGAINQTADGQIGCSRLRPQPRSRTSDGDRTAGLRHSETHFCLINSWSILTVRHRRPQQDYPDIGVQYGTKTGWK